jgi:hypothetical protein
MPALTYYWVGSTAASINSFSWDVVGNWRTVKLASGGSGGTAATLIAATRTPMGTDTVFFGRPYTPASSQTPAPFQIHSPCLFGGVTTDSGVKAWAGTTAGSSTTEKYYPIFATVNPSYPFTKLGGQVSTSVLTEMTRALEFHGGQAYGTRGEWVRIGEEGEAGTVWVNPSYTGVTGTTSGVSFAAQSHYTLRFTGIVNDASRAITTVAMTGVTSGGTAGATASVDGTTNLYTLHSSDVFFAYGSSGLNSDFIAANGWSSGTPTQVGQSYKHGATELYGNWNSIRSYVAIRDLDLTCLGAKVNAIVLEPTYSLVYATSPSGLPTSGFTTATQFDVRSLYFDKDCTARYFAIKNIDQMHGEITVHGDVIPNGGFNCFSPQGASGGVSGGILLSNGSFAFTPPANSSTEAPTPTLRFGFPLSAGTKQSTTITNLYINAGVQSPVVTLDGNFTSTNSYINQGIIQFSANIPQNAAMDVSNLQLNGNSVLDMSLPALYTGTNGIKVIAQSDAATIRPGKGTAMQVSQTLTIG